MSRERSLRRLVRRETHSSRAAASIVAAVVLAAAFLWLAVEAVLALLGGSALLASPAQLGSWLAGVPGATVPAGLVAAGAGIALLGVLLLGTALRAGRRRGTRWTASAAPSWSMTKSSPRPSRRWHGAPPAWPRGKSPQPSGDVPSTSRSGRRRACRWMAQPSAQRWNVNSPATRQTAE